MKLIMENWRLFVENCKIKEACSCVDNSETSLTLKQIQNAFGVEETGICDEATKNAIAKFQEEHSLECDGCVGDETHGKMAELELTVIPVSKGVSKDAAGAGRVKEEEVDSDLSHVQAAIVELSKFNNGALHEREPAAWPLIATYWQHIGSGWLAKATLAGKAYPNTIPDKSGHVKEDHWHWSAAFIQYCMRGNEEFQNLAWTAASRGHHKYYWGAALNNTAKLKAGGLNEGEWFYLTLEEYTSIGYTPQPGDILMQRPGGDARKDHGDIVVSSGGGYAKAGGAKKIGGNLGIPGTCKVSNSENVAVVTQNSDARNKFLEAL